MCGESIMDELIKDANVQMFNENKTISWHKWISHTGKKALEKYQVKGTLHQALQELVSTLYPLKSHIFRANWNQSIFDYSLKNLQHGQVVQIFDFAMNFWNMYQDEIQSAYWSGTQTCIHAVINYFLCQNEGCREKVTLILAQLTDDLQHNSFVARVDHDAAFNYLAQIHVPMELILQFCDNCSSQYKSRCPFAKLARCPLDVIRVYFGEKHGKSHCNGFFSRLKGWMSYKIKAHHFVITDANDFFRCCKEEYETPPASPGTCQHYRVVFQFLWPSDVRRHHDCDLDQAVAGTRSMYSIRNTPEPLKLKVRHTPCLCQPCIADNGENCRNSLYTDPW